MCTEWKNCGIMFEDDRLKGTEYQMKDYGACPEIVDLDLDHNILDTYQGPEADEQGMDLHDPDTRPKTVGNDLEPCQGIHADEHSTATIILEKQTRTLV